MTFMANVMVNPMVNNIWEFAVKNYVIYCFTPMFNQYCKEGSSHVNPDWIYNFIS